MGVTGGGEVARLHAVLPAGCLGCGRALPGGVVPFALCLRCRGRLVAAPSSAWSCRCCGLPLASPGPARFLCAGCRRSPPHYGVLIAPWLYRPPLVEVVLALKFRRLAWLGERLAVPLARALPDAAIADCELVVPVPLHWRRRLTRGFNQAAVIADPLARRLRLGCHEALVRRRATPPQTALPRRGREANLRGAFAVRARHRRMLVGRRVLLVDDVVTTGATLDAAAAALLAAGAVEVRAVAVARTPSPSGSTGL